MTVNKSKAVLQLQVVVKLQCMQRSCALFVLLIGHLFYHSRWLRLWPFLTQTYIATAGKSNGQRPNLPSVSSQEVAAAHSPNLPLRIQAQLPVCATASTEFLAQTWQTSHTFPLIPQNQSPRPFHRVVLTTTEGFWRQTRRQECPMSPL